MWMIKNCGQSFCYPIFELHELILDFNTAPNDNQDLFRKLHFREGYTEEKDLFLSADKNGTPCLLSGLLPSHISQLH